jgi:DNA-directed RNA polymerase subunit H (RpoH/RPB5)
MDATTVDYVVRSRPTICEILTNRGYSVEGYADASPADIFTLVTTKVSSLTIYAKKKEGSAAPMKRAVVLYMIERAIRLSLDTLCASLYQGEDAVLDAKSDEVIIVHNEPPHDAFTLQAQREWQTEKARVSFFPIKNLLSNPAHHIFVPPHRKLSAEEASAVMKRLCVESKGSFPHIKFHADMQARVLGLVPGDLVEINRPSDTSGITTLFRVCTL